MLGARTTVTPFHHQPEAQHLKSLAIHKNAGRLPHLLTQSGHGSGPPATWTSTLAILRSRLSSVCSPDRTTRDPRAIFLRDIAMRYPGYIFQFTAIITPRALCRGWPLRPPCAKLFARLKRWKNGP